MKNFIFSLALILFLMSCDDKEETSLFENDAIENIEDEAVGAEIMENSEEESDNNFDEDSESTEEGNQKEESGITKEVLSSFLMKKSWRITKLMKKTGLGAFDFIENKDDFEAYSFVFNDNEEVIAVKNKGEIKGTWAVVNDVEKGLVLELKFTDNSSFSNLEKRWPIVSLNTEEMVFIYGSRGKQVDNRVFLKMRNL